MNYIYFMLSFFSLEFDINKKLAIKDFSSHIHSPTTVVRQHSPVDLMAELDFFTQEHFLKMTQLGNLIFHNHPNLIKKLHDYLNEIEKTKEKIKQFSLRMNENHQMFHLVSHLRDAHRHYILEFSEKNPKFILQHLFIVKMTPSQMQNYIQENLHQLSDIEIDILNQPYEFRLWLFEFLKKEMNQSSENDALKELLAKQLDQSLALKQQYLRLFTSNIKKAVSEIQKFREAFDALLSNEKSAIHQLRQSLLSLLSSQYQMLNMFRFEFAVFQAENLTNKELSSPIIEKIKELQYQRFFSARFDFFSPIELTPVSKQASDEPVEEWGFFDDLEPQFSMMVLESVYHGTFIDNDIFEYYAAHHFHASQSSKQKVYMENHIFQVYHSEVSDETLINSKIVS